MSPSKRRQHGLFSRTPTSQWRYYRLRREQSLLPRLSQRIMSLMSKASKREETPNGFHIIRIHLLLFDPLLAADGDVQSRDHPSQMRILSVKVPSQDVSLCKDPPRYQTFSSFDTLHLVRSLCQLGCVDEEQRRWPHWRETRQLYVQFTRVRMIF